jgi:RND family efflux transporter MFP subunit
MQKLKTILLGTLLVTSNLIAACTAGSNALTQRDNAPSTNSSVTVRPLTVRVVDAQPAPLSSPGDLLIPAALSVENTAVVLAEREGQVIKINGREGGRFRKGDVLAQFNDDDQRSQLQQVELEVRRLQVEEQQYEALVKLSRSELERELSLAKEGVSSKSDVERARYKLDQATHEYEKTRLATESGRARSQAARIEAEKSIVRAPIAGVITHRYIALGTSVARNEKLFEVATLSPLEVRFQLPQNEKNRLSAGQILQLSLTNGGRLIGRVRIRRVDPVADSTTNTFGYLADVIGGADLMPGMAVNIHLPRPADGVAFWLPRGAFPSGATLRIGYSGSLFVVEGGRAISRTVVVSALEGDQVEVGSGLEKNDRIVLNPPGELKDGDAVELSPT